MTTRNNAPLQFYTWKYSNEDKKRKDKGHVFHEQTVLSWEKTVEIKQKKKEKETAAPKGICNNRECDNPSGYLDKPNSIYCSSKCQSRGM